MTRAPAPSDAATEHLADALHRAAADLDRRAPPAAVQEAVLARLAVRTQAADQMAAVGPAGPRAGRASPWAPWATAALCGVLLLASTVLLLRPPAGAGSGDRFTDRGWAAQTDTLGFLPAGSAERWLGGGAGGRPSPAWVVSAELPRERLVEFGLPFDPSRAADTVRAELLLRGNGEVMAVRVLADEAR